MCWYMGNNCDLAMVLWVGCGEAQTASYGTMIIIMVMVIPMHMATLMGMHPMGNHHMSHLNPRHQQRQRKRLLDNISECINNKPVAKL